MHLPKASLILLLCLYSFEGIAYYQHFQTIPNLDKVYSVDISDDDLVLIAGRETELSIFTRNTSDAFYSSNDSKISSEILTVSMTNSADYILGIPNSLPNQLTVFKKDGNGIYNVQS